MPTLMATSPLATHGTMMGDESMPHGAFDSDFSAVTDEPYCCLRGEPLHVRSGQSDMHLVAEPRNLFVYRRGDSEGLSFFFETLDGLVPVKQDIAESLMNQRAARQRRAPGTARQHAATRQKHTGYAGGGRSPYSPFAAPPTPIEDYEDDPGLLFEMDDLEMVTTSL